MNTLRNENRRLRATIIRMSEIYEQIHLKNLKLEQGDDVTEGDLEEVIGNEKQQIR